MTSPIDTDVNNLPDDDMLASYEAYAADPTLGSPRLGYTSASEVVPAGSVVKEFRDRKTGASTNRNFVKVYFSELLQITHPNNVSGGAILIEAVYDRAKVSDPANEPEPEDEGYYNEGYYNIGLKSVWLPKKLCSNLICTPEQASLNQNSVEVWNVFLRNNYPELELPEDEG